MPFLLVLCKAILASLGSFLLHTYLGLTLSHRRDDAGESFIQSARRSAKRRETTNSGSASLPIPNPPRSFSSLHSMLPTKGCPENQHPALLTSGKPRGQSQAPFFLASLKPLYPFQKGPACWIVCKTPLSFMAHLGSVEPDDWWLRVETE